MKQLLKRYPFILHTVTAVYSLLHNGLPLKPIRGCRIQCKGAFLRKCKFNIIGGGNTIIINELARLSNCTLTIIGNNCTIEIGGRHTIVSNTSFWCQQNGSSIIIGKDFMMGGGGISAIEGRSVKIGEDCMLSEDIDIRNGDSHGIYSADDGHRINHAKDIEIADHVWITAHARVLKGAKIPTHSIVGNSAVVSSQFEEAHAIYAGVPARKVKSGIVWHKYTAENIYDIIKND